eukprot:2210344-Pyramimonas_sp.AAC.2
MDFAPSPRPGSEEPVVHVGPDAQDALVQLWPDEPLREPLVHELGAQLDDGALVTVEQGHGCVEASPRARPRSRRRCGAPELGKPGGRDAPDL